MRRLLVIALASPILISACSSAAATAAPTAAPTVASTAASIATPIPTAASTLVPTAAATLSPAAAPVDAGWIVVAPAGDGFTSKFPGQPKLTTTTTSAQEGPTPTSVWEYLANPNLDYNLALWQYPAGSTTGMAPAAMYDSTITGMASTNGLTLSTQSDVTLNGHAGRATTLGGASYTLQGELFLVGDNLYMVYGSYAPGVDPSGVVAFLADFGLTA